MFGRSLPHTNRARRRSIESLPQLGSSWTKIFTAKPVAQIDGCVTFARIVFVGPVLKKRQKQAAKRKTHTQGNGARNKAITNGKPASIAAPETRKYEPGSKT